MKLLRYSLRSQSNPLTLEKMTLALREHVSLFQEFFDATTDDAQKPHPEDVWNTTLRFCQFGDFYISFNDSEKATGVIYIHDRAGTRNGGVVAYNATPAHLSKAAENAFTKQDYRKLLVSSPEPVDLYVQAGFIMTGISHAEGLFNDVWKSIITLELVSPRWATEEIFKIGEEVNTVDGCSVSVRPTRAAKPELFRRICAVLCASAAAVYKPFCGH
jgi:hypothetical protein